MTKQLIQLTTHICIHTYIDWLMLSQQNLSTWTTVTGRTTISLTVLTVNEFIFFREIFTDSEYIPRRYLVWDIDEKNRKRIKWRQQYMHSNSVILARITTGNSIPQDTPPSTTSLDLIRRIRMRHSRHQVFRIATSMHRSHTQVGTIQYPVPCTVYQALKIQAKMQMDRRRIY